jgi:hypothetical protein
MVAQSGAESEERPKQASVAELEKIPASNFTKVIDHSASPNKRLAVAVGSKDGIKPDWQNSDHPGRTSVVEISFLLVGDDSSANYLINVLDDRVVGVLDGSHLGTLNSYNHNSHAASWSPDSHWLVETQQWKWATGTCTIHRLSADGLLVARVSLHKAANKTALINPLPLRSRSRRGEANLNQNRRCALSSGRRTFDVSL